MKIVYVISTLGRGGGPKVLCEHVSRLAARGHQAELWCLAGSDLSWFGPVPHRVFPHTDQLGAALRDFHGIKIATYWITASWVASCLHPGEKGYYLIQDEDELTYSGSNAGTSYRLGLRPITEGAMLTALMRDKYGLECTNVGIGLDHRVFRPLPMIRERYRVLTPAGRHPVKGWADALHALRLLVNQETKASIVTFGDAPVVIPNCSHVHLVAPSDGKLRELYSQSGVFLSASHHEGFGLPHLEAMACGCPVVCTDAFGNREHCRDNDTALVSPPGDAANLAASMLRVMHDQDLAGRLRAAGIEEAQRYNWDDVILRLEKALGLAMKAEHGSSQIRKLAAG